MCNTTTTYDGSAEYSADSAPPTGDCSPVYRQCGAATTYDGGADYSADSAAPSDDDTPAHHQCRTTTIHDGGAEYSVDSAAPSDDDTPAHHQCSTTTIHDGGAEYSADSAAPSDDDIPVHRQRSAATTYDRSAEYSADSAPPTGDCSSVNRQCGAATADDCSAEYSADSAAPATDEPGIPSEIQQLATSLREMGQNIAQSSHQNINHLTQAAADQARVLGHETQEMVDMTLSDQHQRYLDSTKRVEQNIGIINDQHLGATQRQERRIDQVAGLFAATEKNLEERLERMQRDIQAHAQTVTRVYQESQRRTDPRPDAPTRKAPPVANYVPRRQPQPTAQTRPNPRQPIRTNATSNQPAKAATRQVTNQPPPPPDEQPCGTLPDGHQDTARATPVANSTANEDATPPLTGKELWQGTERVWKMTGTFTPKGTDYNERKGKQCEEFPSFAKRFEHMAKFYEIPKANWAHMFATCLATNAHDEYLAMSKEQQDDFSQTVEHLSKIYPAPMRNEWTYRIQWDALRQAQDEPLRDFVARIESLAHKAHTSLNSHGLENEKIMKFRYGLASSYLRYDLAAVMAETLQELGSRAIAIQMSRDADPATMWAGTTEASEVARDLGTTPISIARTARFEPQQHPMGEATRLPYAYPHTMPPATTCVTYVPASSFAVPATPPPPTPSYNPPTQPPPGHPQGSERRRQQPKDEGYPKKRRGDYQRGMDLASIRCYNCGELGHLANKCPRPDKRLQRNYHGGNRGRGSRGGNRANSYTDNRQSSDAPTPLAPTPERQNVPPTEQSSATQDSIARQYRAQGVPTNADLDLSMDDVGSDPLMRGGSRRAMIRFAGADLTSSRSKSPSMHTQALTTEEETERLKKPLAKQEKAAPAPPAALPEVPKPFGASAVHGFNPSLIDKNSMTIHPELEELPYSSLDLSASIISKHPLSIACSTRDGYVLWPGVALPAPAAEALFESCKNDQVSDNRQMSLFMSGSLVPVSNLDLEGSLVTDKMLNQLVRSQTNNLRKISLRNCRLLSHEANHLLGSPQAYLPRLEQFDLGNLVCLFKRWADDTSDVRRYMDSVQQGSGPEESPTQPISNGPFSWDYRSMTPFQDYVHSDLRASSSLSSPADASAGRFAASPAGYGAALDGNATAVKCSTASVMDRSGSEATAGSVSPDVFHDSQGTSHGEKSLNVFSRSIDRSASLGFVNHITTMCPNLLALTLHGDTFDIVFDSTSHGGTPVRASTFPVMVLEPVSVLLQKGASVTALNNEGSTALHIACQHGHADIVALLLYYGADPILVNKQRKTPFDLACEYGRVKVLQSLIESRPCVRWMKETRNGLQDIDNTTPLHLAAKNGHVDVIKCLVDACMDVNRKVQRGSALHESVLVGKVDSIAFPLATGADVSVTNNIQQTPLDLAKKHCKSSSAKDIKFLLKEATNAVYARTTQTHSAKSQEELIFGIGEILWVIELGPEKSIWRGLKLDPKFSARLGSFSSSAVQVVDREVAMQRSQPHRQVEKVGIPEVPDVQSPLPTTRKHRVHSSAYGSVGHLDEGVHPSTSGESRTTPVHQSNSCAFAYPPRNRSPERSTSMPSPPSRNSYHSSGSSSLGSLERSDETGTYVPPVNVAELLLNGAPDHEIIQVWLQSLHYEEYIALFLNAGYDLPTVTRMTPEDLTAIGITKPGHRKRLTTEIHKMGTPDNLPYYKPASLREWSCVLRLGEYTAMFENQGYRTINGLAMKRLKEVKNNQYYEADHQRHHPQGHHPQGHVPGEAMIISVGHGPRLTEVRPYSHAPDRPDPYSTFNGDYLSVSVNGYPEEPMYPEAYMHEYVRNYHTYPFPHQNGHQQGDCTPTPKPKLTVKPRPVAKIVAKTKRPDGDVPQDLVYLELPLKGSCAMAYTAENSAPSMNHGQLAYAPCASTSVIMTRPPMLHSHDHYMPENAQYDHYSSPVRRMHSHPASCGLDIIHCSPAHYRNGGMALPRCLPVIPSHHYNVQSDSELMCAGLENGNCFRSRRPVDGTETGSLADFPPLPSPLTCGDSINALKTIRQSSTEPNPYSGVYPRETGSASSPSTPTIPHRIPRHNPTGTPSEWSLPHPDRNGHPQYAPLAATQQLPRSDSRRNRKPESPYASPIARREEHTPRHKTSASSAYSVKSDYGATSPARVVAPVQPFTGNASTPYSNSVLTRVGMTPADVEGPQRSLASSTTNEERYQSAIRKPSRKIDRYKDKVQTLATQLSTDDSVVSAFEHSLSAMKNRLTTFTSTFEGKDQQPSDRHEPPNQLYGMCKQSGIQVNTVFSPQTTRRQNSDPATGSTPPSGILTRQPVKESMNSSISQRLPVSNASSNVPQGNPEPLDKKAKKCWLRSLFIRAFTKSKRTPKQGSIGGSPSDGEEAQRAASVKEAALSNEYAGPSETAPATKDRMEADVPEPNADTTTPQRERSERPPAPSASCVVGQ